MLFAEPDSFEIIVEGCKLRVKEHEVGAAQVFHIIFSDGRKPLAITKAKTAAGEMWMSVPQGRQQEAMQIGEVITEYFKKR